ncbi:hypothetical protein M405DRAFT_826991 [Rhizopogon salebrosus TDB-379]|nr:hypothetical protein M405DRAFT_826991 [Rhizopogon salebrosus TDB-379]
MALKNKGKKGKADDDDHWATAGVSVENYDTPSNKIGDPDGDVTPVPQAAQAEDKFPEDQKKKKGKKDGEEVDAGETDKKDTAADPAPTPEDEGAELREMDQKKEKKKKKKKGRKDEDVAPAAAPAKKAKGGISALKAMMEEKKRLKEEAQRKEEERKPTEEEKQAEEEAKQKEEERQAEEEAKWKEEERQTRKEKQQAKIELAKESQFLTEKQKEEKAAAELRRQALDDEDMLDDVMSDLTSLSDSVDKSGHGICAQASTLGSLEALLDFLKINKIPVSGINIGPVHKKDVMRAATMLEKAKELAVILCFDIPVNKDAQMLAEEMGIKVFKADTISHLFDVFTAYNNDIAPQAVWPCRLKTIACFCKRNPILLRVDILDGTLRVGTPLCVVTVDPVTQRKKIIDLGKVASLEINHKPFNIVKKSQVGAGVTVKIERAVYESAKMFGRHFEEKDELFSHITRQSIDVLKTSFKTDVSTEEWLLIKALKRNLNIP